VLVVNVVWGKGEQELGHATQLLVHLLQERKENESDVARG